MEKSYEPGACGDCCRLLNVQSKQVVGVYERLQINTGKVIHTVVANPETEYLYGPEGVLFDDGSVARQDEVAGAFLESLREWQKRDKEVKELLSGCPGLKEVVLAGETPTVVRICGKSVLEAETLGTLPPEITGI